MTTVNKKRGKDREVTPATMGTLNPMPRLLSLKAASTYMGLTLWMVRRMVWDGEVNFVQAGRKIFIEVEELGRWVQQHRCKNDELSNK
jgi:excisionase family DNA binding protein